ncbi:unnamed protein product, partial [Staurois parvus]
MCQCPSMTHISAHLSCLSMSPISASATYQCHLSVPVSPISAHQFQPVPPLSAHQCHLS